MSVLCVSGLSVAYDARPVLRDVALDVNEGEFVALVGPNGAGKTTLLRAISGVVEAQAGSIEIDGLDMRNAGPRERARRIAVVPQVVHLPAAFTVSEIVLMGRTPHLPLWGGEGRRDLAIAWNAVCQTDLATLVGRRADELSGGERQRVVIARALTQEPRVLLLDEATAHLDLKHQLQVLDLVRRLARERGLAVLATLHDLNQAATHADRLALLSAGEIRAVGAPRDVLTAAHLGSVYGVPVDVVDHPRLGMPLVVPGRAASSREGAD